MWDNREMNTITSPSVVITGVSTGIGYATAKLLISKGIRVFGSIRNTEDAERLSKEWGPLFHPLIFDVTDSHSVQQAANLVREQLKGHKLWGLINNAGIAVPGALLYMPIADFQKQLNTNLTGQLIVIQAFTPVLGADKELTGDPGKIINISSVSGKNGFPFMGAYATSKFGFEGLSETLRRELMIFGIDVIIVGPGIIKTPIWDKIRKQSMPAEVAKSVYQQPAQICKDFILSGEKNGLPAENVANLLLKILQSKHPKTRYAPVPNKLINWTIPNLLPKRFVDWVIAKKIGLIK
jgi:NAD(P)-dependent dehydrogenase (short-subunit alcohol dehydrogenase family)